jgi:hypothetical protein
MSKELKFVVLFFFLFSGTYFLYNYLYQNHRNIQLEKAEVIVSVEGLIDFFKKNESEKVINKILEINGLLTDIGSKSVTIDNKVQCSFNFEIKDFKINQNITVKGRCIGYDELFEIVKIDQSSIIK